MKLHIQTELEEAKKDFELFCKLFETKANAVKKDLDIVGLRAALGMLKEEISRWSRALR